MPKGAESSLVPSRNIDQRMLDAAVRAAVNEIRCRKDLPVLATADRGMIASAEAHSDWMARTGRLSHEGGARGRKTLSDRILWSAAVTNRAAENIAMIPRYRTGTREFRILDRQACRFATKTGDPIPAQSYASLARETVAAWMDSPSHRRNILDPRMRNVATAAGYSPSEFCGRFWLTQIFTG